jgi:hypothetical protein
MSKEFKAFPPKSIIQYHYRGYLKIQFSRLAVFGKP